MNVVRLRVQSCCLIAVSLVATFSATAQDKKIATAGLSQEFVDAIRQAATCATVVAVPRGSLAEVVQDADAVIGDMTPADFRAAKKLKWLQINNAGTDRYRYPEFVSSDVVLTNGKIIQGPNIADHAFALLLALTRGMYVVIPQRVNEQVRRGSFEPIELRGKTAVIIGVGGIGMQIAQRAHGFDMKVIGVDPKDIPLSPYISKMVYPDRLDTVLPEADVVFVAAPWTPETNGMMGPRQFELLKKGTYFIGMSRGKIFNTDALVKALDSRRLAGAGMDVTDPEPLPKGHPLWKFENVIITPHYAGGSDNVDKRRIEMFKENVGRFCRGEQLINVVDKKKGY